MKTLKLDYNTAIKLYPKADPILKAILEDSFGKSFFSQKITDRIKTFEDALSFVDPDDEDLKTLLSYTGNNPIMHGAQAEAKLNIIADVLNEKWTPDWNDINQPKYYPWFKMKSGFGFSDSGTSCDHSYANVGSRLVFKSAELAEYAAKQFESIYQDFLTF